MNVLVLDGENKNALAAVRSLGRRGVFVTTGSRRRLARSFVSRYSGRSIVYPTPAQDDGKAFVDNIAEVVQRHAIDVVLPIADASTRALAKHRDLLPDECAIPVADWPAFEIAAFKPRTFEFASEQGLEVPRVYEDKSDVDVFPVVVKHSFGTGRLRYVNSRAELTNVDTSNAVMQEYIPGAGYGFFALFEHGRERAIFMHRRIREYPITGGASSAAESIYDPVLRDLGLRLLRALHWHGVAMVEFKKDRRDGVYKLMEVNPKFWGSLDLAIVSGVDFPWLVTQMALGQLDETVLTYRRAVRFQWVWDDLKHVAARPSAARNVLRDLRHAENDVSLDDLKPALFDAVETAGTIVVRAASGQLRHPHGVPNLSAVGCPMQELHERTTPVRRS
jgi:predicted ATP-grasp superfamily ATP-dependent carboligase